MYMHHSIYFIKYVYAPLQNANEAPHVGTPKGLLAGERCAHAYVCVKRAHVHVCVCAYACACACVCECVCVCVCMCWGLRSAWFPLWGWREYIYTCPSNTYVLYPRLPPCLSEGLVRVML